MNRIEKEACLRFKKYDRFNDKKMNRKTKKQYKKDLDSFKIWIRNIFQIEVVK